MADYIIKDSELVVIANAIRTKGGTSSPLVFPNGFTSAINAIPTGGGTGNIISGTSEPTSLQGSDGDIYLKLSPFGRVDYIEFSGYSWVSTGYLPKQNSKYIMDFDLLQPTNYYDTPFGSRYGNDVFVAYSGGNYRFVWGNASDSVANISSYYGQRVQMVLESTRCALEQEGVVLAEKTFSGTLTSPGTVPIGLFALQSAQSSADIYSVTKGKFREFKIYEDGTLVNDYVPFVDYNNVPFFYDSINGTAHFNEASSSLTYGTLQEIMGYSVSNAYYKQNGSWIDLIGASIDVN